MALVQTTLKTNLLTLFNLMKKAPMSEANFADGLATIINDYIKTAEVTVEVGITVKTTGTALEQTGVTTAPGRGSLS
jgi:hypothetical protein